MRKSHECHSERHAKNLAFTATYEGEILRLSPQDDIATPSPTQGRMKEGGGSNGLNGLNCLNFTIQEQSMTTNEKKEVESQSADGARANSRPAGVGIAAYMVVAVVAVIFVIVIGLGFISRRR